MIRRLTIVCLRVALVAALIWGGWRIYRRLPADANSIPLFGSSNNSSDAAHETELKIIMRRPPDDNHEARLSFVELYSVDATAAAARGLSPERHSSEEFDDYLKRRKGAAAIKVTLDNNGQGRVKLRAGLWWMRATLSNGARELTWRLPINVSGPTLTIELTPENAYTRSRNF